ncbi:MAG: TA system antitoxin ParD family protein, partial [Patescibacteria group bacterium]
YKGWPDWTGIGGRLQTESVAGMKWNGWPDSNGITGRLALEYAHWAKIGKCAEENPDLTYDLIKEILIGIAELEQGEKEEYQFG